MTRRGRVLAAFSHQQPDRVPIDLGGSVVSGIGAKAYTRLKQLLNLELGETQIFDRMNQLAVVDMPVLDLLGVDTRPLKGGLPDSFPDSDRADEYTFDSDDFPKVVFRDQINDDVCGSCWSQLAEPAPSVTLKKRRMRHF